MSVMRLCLLLIALGGCAANPQRLSQGRTNQQPMVSSTSARKKQGQAANQDAATLARKLQSKDDVERKQAQTAMRALAKESSEGRQAVISELIKIMEDSNARLRMESGAHYDAWEFAAETLGELQATEALDALIACLDCNNGVGGLSFYRFPALRAVTLIGPAAITKLTEALSSGSRTSRIYSALALGEINGPVAKKALEQASQTEQDEEVLRSIRIGLRRH